MSPLLKTCCRRAQHRLRAYLDAGTPPPRRCTDGIRGTSPSAVDIVRGFPGLPRPASSVTRCSTRGSKARRSGSAKRPRSGRARGEHHAVRRRRGEHGRQSRRARRRGQLRFSCRTGLCLGRSPAPGAAHRRYRHHAGLVKDLCASSSAQAAGYRDGEYVVRFDEGDTEQVSERSRAALLRRIADMYARCDAVVVSDHCHGTVCDQGRRHVDSAARAQSEGDRRRLEGDRALRRSPGDNGYHERARPLRHRSPWIERPTVGLRGRQRGRDPAAVVVER